MSHKNERTLQNSFLRTCRKNEKNENENADLKMKICKESQRIGEPHFKGYIWLAAKWQGGHVGGQYNKQIF